MKKRVFLYVASILSAAVLFLLLPNAAYATDSDNDGVDDSRDLCPNFGAPTGSATVNQWGCSTNCENTGNCPDTTCPATGGGGNCGTANGVAVSSAPTTNLCSAGGTASSVSGTGPWTWTCGGSGGQCSAPVQSSGGGTCGANSNVPLASNSDCRYRVNDNTGVTQPVNTVRVSPRSSGPPATCPATASCTCQTSGWACTTTGGSTGGAAGTATPSSDPFTQAYGWYTRSGSSQSTPYRTSSNVVRQTVIRWDGQTIFDSDPQRIVVRDEQATGATGPVTVDGYTYTPSTTRRGNSVSDWRDDQSNAFDVSRVASGSGSGGAVTETTVCTSAISGAKRCHPSSSSDSPLNGVEECKLWQGEYRWVNYGCGNYPASRCTTTGGQPTCTGTASQYYLTLFNIYNTMFNGRTMTPDEYDHYNGLLSSNSIEYPQIRMELATSIEFKDMGNVNMVDRWSSACFTSSIPDDERATIIAALGTNPSIDTVRSVYNSHIASRAGSSCALYTSSAGAPTPTITGTGSASGGTMGMTYTNLPPNSYVQVINQATGNVWNTYTGLSGDGSWPISLVPPGTYFLRVKQPAITAGTSQDRTIIESSPPSPPFIVVGTGAGGTTPPTNNPPAPTASITVNGQAYSSPNNRLQLAPGNARTVFWSSNLESGSPTFSSTISSEGSNCNNPSPIVPWGINSRVGEVSITPAMTTQFSGCDVHITFTAKDSVDSSITATANLYVRVAQNPNPPPQAPTITFSRSPATLRQGESQTVSWSTANAASLSYSCTGAGPNANHAVSKPLQFGPDTNSWDTIYNTLGWRGAYSCTWTATGQGGTATHTDNFNILPPPEFRINGETTANIARGDTVQVTVNGELNSEVRLTTFVEGESTGPCYEGGCDIMIHNSDLFGGTGSSGSFSTTIPSEYTINWRYGTYDAYVTVNGVQSNTVRFTVSADSGGE